VLGIPGATRRLASILTLALLAAPQLSAMDKVSASPGGLPMAFEENRGQTDTKVKFISHGPRYTQFVTAKEVVWHLDGDNRDSAVYMSLPGATPAKVHGEALLPLRSSDLKGGPKKWVKGAQQFAAVKLSKLYPGVSLKLYGSRVRPEYDFIVEPDADASVIRMHFAGADSVKVGLHGELIVRTVDGDLLHHTPIAFQHDRAGRSVRVDAQFAQVNAREVRLELGAYDKSRQLVID
jgi:hypothetical protein